MPTQDSYPALAALDPTTYVTGFYTSGGQLVTVKVPFAFIYGNKWNVGSGAPTIQGIATGDLYLDQTTGDVWRWNQTALNWGSAPFMNIVNGEFTWPLWVPSKPTSSQVVGALDSPWNGSITTNFQNCYANADVAATASTVFSITQNGGQIGTLTFGAGQTVGTFSTGGPFNINKADVIRVIAPASQDATLSGVRISMVFAVGGTVGATALLGLALQKANNLSDVQSAQTSRTNLGVPGLTTANTMSGVNTFTTTVNITNGTDVISLNDNGNNVLVVSGTGSSTAKSIATTSLGGFIVSSDTNVSDGVALKSDFPNTAIFQGLNSSGTAGYDTNLTLYRPSATNNSYLGVTMSPTPGAEQHLWMATDYANSRYVFTETITGTGAYLPIAFLNGQAQAFQIGTGTTPTTTFSGGGVVLNGTEGNQVTWTLGGQTWSWNAQSGGNFYVHDGTNNKFPLTVVPNSTVSLQIGATNSTFTGGMVATGQVSLGGLTNAESLRVLNVPSAVNFVQVYGGTTGNTPTIQTTGGDTNIGLNLITKGSGSMGFYTHAGGTPQMAIIDVASNVNYLQLQGASTGNGPGISSQGSDTNIDLATSSKGTGRHSFWTGSFARAQFAVTDTASAVNYAQATGAPTNNGPIFSAQGSDTNINLNLQAKGTGSVVVGTGGGSQLVVANAASAVNYVQVSGSPAGGGPAISVQGSDTNIQMSLYSKGTANIVAYTNGGVPQFVVQPSASATRYLTVVGSTTNPTIGTSAGSVAFSSAIALNTTTAHGILIGQGTGNVTQITPTTAGNLIVDGGPSADPYSAPVASVFPGVSGRNRIINGAMIIDQYGSTTHSTSGYGGVDRYYVGISGTGGAVTQAASTMTWNSISIPCIKSTVSTAFTSIASSNFYEGIKQVIEGLNCYDLANQQITVSFIFNATVAGTYAISLRDGGSAYSYVTTFSYATGGTPQKITVTFPATTLVSIPISINAGLILDIGALNTGTFATSTLNAWQTGNFITTSTVTNYGSTLNNFIAVAELQLEAGGAATAFERRPQQHELTLCQRYYQSGTTASGTQNSATQGYVFGPFQVPMRTGPSVAITPGSVTIFNGSNVSATIGSIAASSKDWLGQVTFSSSGAVGYGVSLTNNSGETIWFSAEL